MAIKIFLNSLYGGMGNKYFRYYNIENAEAITVSGQLFIRAAEKFVNKLLNKKFETIEEDYVVASDTDSLYLTLPHLTSIEEVNTFCVNEILPGLKSCFDKMSKLTGSYKNAINMKLERICEHAIFTAKKRYILSINQEDGVVLDTPKIKVTGIESIRSSTPEVVRNRLRESFKIILDDGEDEFIDFVDNFKRDFFSMPADAISKQTTVSSVDKYVEGNSYKKGTPFHARGAIAYNNKIKELGLESKYFSIKNGEKVRTIYLKECPHYSENVISFSNVLPKEFQLEDYIDYELQFEKTFLKPLKPIIEQIGWKLEKSCNVLDFI